MVKTAFQQDAFQDDAFQTEATSPTGAGTGTSTWSYKLDGVELNDYVYFLAEIPEIDNVADMEPVLIPVDGDYPVFLRLQPAGRILSVNIQIMPCSWALYSSRLNWIKTSFDGGPHLLTVQAHGMSIPKSINVYTTSIAIGDPKSRRVSVQVTAPEPNWI